MSAISNTLRSTRRQDARWRVRILPKAASQRFRPIRRRRRRFPCRRKRLAAATDRNRHAMATGRRTDAASISSSAKFRSARFRRTDASKDFIAARFPTRGQQHMPTARPLSPHLQIYRWQLTMVLSIIHRATGVALAAGTILLIVLLLSLAAGPDAYQSVRACCASWLGLLMLFGWSWALCFHMFNGLRHL